MAKLTSVEKMALEKFLGMSGGYVLDFTNRSFQEFILDNVQIDIYKEKYSYDSGSKANRLRALWDKEENFIIGKLIINLLEYWKAQKLINSAEITPAEQDLFNECAKIAENFRKNSQLKTLTRFFQNLENRTFHH